MRPGDLAVEEERLREAAEGGGPEPEAATPDELDEDAPGGGEGGDESIAAANAAKRTGCAGGLAGGLNRRGREGRADADSMCRAPGRAPRGRREAAVRRRADGRGGAHRRRSTPCARPPPRRRRRSLLVDGRSRPFNRSTVHAEIERRARRGSSSRFSSGAKDNWRYNPRGTSSSCSSCTCRTPLDGVSDYVIVDSDVVFFRAVRFGAARGAPGPRRVLQPLQLRAQLRARRWTGRRRASRERARAPRAAASARAAAARPVSAGPRPRFRQVLLDDERAHHRPVPRRAPDRRRVGGTPRIAHHIDENNKCSTTSARLSSACTARRGSGARSAARSRSRTRAASPSCRVRL